MKCDWVDWSGGDMPVHGNVYVQARFRSGLESALLPACMVQWEHGYRGIEKHSADVVQYREFSLPENGGK